MKVNSCHCMTRLRKIKRKINEGMPGDEAIPLIKDLVEIIVKHEDVAPNKAMDISKELRYQSLGGRIKAHLIFRERFWQRHVFPKLTFDTTRCVKCGNCAKVCPVQRIEMTVDGPTVPKGNPDCVHCASCIRSCPAEAIDFDADWERWNKLLAKAADGLGPIPSNELPKSAVYPRALNYIQMTSDHKGSSNRDRLFLYFRFAFVLPRKKWDGPYVPSLPRLSARRTRSPHCRDVSHDPSRPAHGPVPPPGLPATIPGQTARQAPEYLPSEAVPATPS